MMRLNNAAIEINLSCDMLSSLRDTIPKVGIGPVFRLSVCVEKAAGKPVHPTHSNRIRAADAV